MTIQRGEKKEMAEPKATYIIASYSMSEVFDLVAQSIKAKAKLEGKEVPATEFVSLVLAREKDGINGTAWAIGASYATATFKE
jgi:hypothetical protein